MHVPLLIILLGVIGGVLPDALQLLYFKTRSPFLTPLQRFHIWIQEGKDRPEWPLWVGLTFQAILILAVISFRRFL
jgi:hypothetical protein